MPKALDITGQRFGKLVVLRRAPKLGRSTAWLCQCDCGRQKAIRTHNLMNKTHSCGCILSAFAISLGKAKRTHGHSVTVNGKGAPSGTYKSWCAMRARCLSPNTAAYPKYSVFGICKAWRDSFESFLNDMGERPPGHTLDRIDNRFGYFPSNCRWSTRTDQQRNRSVTLGLRDGLTNERISLEELAQRIAMPPQSLYGLLKKCGVIHATR